MWSHTTQSHVIGYLVTLGTRFRPPLKILFHPFACNECLLHVAYLVFTYKNICIKMSSRMQLMYVHANMVK